MSATSRRLAAWLLGAGLVVAAAGHAAAGPVVEPGGHCNGTVDAACRHYNCNPDELDCGMVPPCLVWVTGWCVVG